MRVLDTDTCIEILRGKSAVIDKRATVNDFVATTWITACELYFGAAKSKAPEHNSQLAAELLSTMNVLGLDDGAARVFGQIKASLQSRGAMLADADLFIASIVISRDAVLVTGNRRHYQRIEDLRIEDWIRG